MNRNRGLALAILALWFLNVATPRSRVRHRLFFIDESTCDAARSLLVPENPQWYFGECQEKVPPIVCPDNADCVPPPEPVD